MNEYRDNNNEEEGGGAVIQEETKSDDIDEEDVVVVDGESNGNDNDGVFNTSMELTGSDAVNILYHERKRRTWKRLLVGSCVVLVLILVIVAVKKPSQQNQTEQKSTAGGSSTTTENPFFQNSDNDDTNENMPVTSTKFLLCDESIQCETDRWGHNQKLKLGHSMCNDQWRFGVGIYESTTTGGNKETGTKHSKQGALLWQDCQQDILLVLQEVNMTTVPKSANDLGFYMTDTAVFQILDGTDQVLWELPSTKSSSIVPSQRCLTNPQMDCPYLHLRKNGGNIVLNWIDNKDGWDARKVHKVYPGLFPNDFE